MPLMTVIDPMEIFFPPDYIGTAAGETAKARFFTEPGGKTVECAICVRESGNGGELRITRVISTDLRDYLDPALQPGRSYFPRR